MTAFAGEVHPLADLFPMLSDDDLATLAESIASDGLLSPIVLDDEGRLLDGRNRLAACSMAGIEPHFTTYTGDDPAGFVIASNVARRHMTTGQRAMATAMVLAADGKRRDGRWAYGIQANSEDLPNSAAWQKALRQAGTILDHVPSLAPDVAAGTLPLDNAYKQACTVRDNVDKDAQRVAEIEKYAPDLLPLVREERMSLAEAHAAALERERERASRVRAGRDAAQSIAMEFVTAAASIVDAWDVARPDEQRPHFTNEHVKQIKAALTSLTEAMKGQPNTHG